MSSSQINDKGAKHFGTGILPISYLPKMQEIADTGQYTDGGVKKMGASLLYPFYGGVARPDSTIMAPYGYPVTMKHSAQDVYDGTAAVVIVNALPCDVDVTRPYRDGGWMEGIPYDGVSVTNRIPGRQKMGGKEYFGVGGYLNGMASIFYGAGAVLYMTPKDSKYPTTAIGYSMSMGGGYGIDFSDDVSNITDPEKWFKARADHTTGASGLSIGQNVNKIDIRCSVANSTNMKHNHGGVWCCMLQPV